MATDQKMATDDVSLKEICKQLDKLIAEVDQIKKKVDPDKDKDSELSELAALLPLFGLLPLSFGATFLFPLSLRLGAARALALGRALEHAAKLTGHSGKESGDASALMKQMFNLKLSNDEQRKLLEALAIYWKAKTAG